MAGNREINELEILPDARVRHRWDLSPKQAAALQGRLASLVSSGPLDGQVKTIAGVDCCFLDKGARILACAVLFDAKEMIQLDSAHVIAEVPMAYIPGLLSFREAPAELQAIAALAARPDLIMVDGAGIAHMRGLGIASHLGLWLGIPTIGVAKSRLVGNHRPVGRRRGSSTRLEYKGSEVGRVLRSRDNVRPLFISVGHRIALDQAVAWVLRTGKGFRLPEPVRQADKLAAERKRGR